jgi:hypothetical protein
MTLPVLLLMITFAMFTPLISTITLPIASYNIKNAGEGRIVAFGGGNGESGISGPRASASSGER